MAIASNPQQILYAANYYQNTISAFRINRDSGMLSKLDIGLVRTPSSPADIAVVDGKFLYAIGWNEPAVYTY